MTPSGITTYVFPTRRQQHRSSVVGALLCLWAGSFLLHASAQAPTNARPETNAGRQLFESVCAGCHGLDARGGERGPNIATRPQIAQLSDAALLDILRGGRPAAGMPPFDTLGATNLKELVAYLRVLQGQGAVAALPGDPRNGKTLFFGKARCSECHTMQGSGGFLGRDLSAYGVTPSPSEIRSGILHPDPANKANQTAVISMRDSQNFTGVIRNEDNFSIQLQSPDGTFHFLARSAIAKIAFLPQPIMPTDYATTLKTAELDDLVSFIISASKAGKPTPKDEDE
jgi:cytochrome c oxidase cbb3-type subunit III